MEGRGRGLEDDGRPATGQKEKVHKVVEKARVEARGLPLPPPPPLQAGELSDTEDGLRKGDREQTEKAATQKKAQALPARRLETERKDDGKKSDFAGALKNAAARPVTNPLEKSVDL